MTAIYKHELSSWFTGMSGYVTGAFILLFAGIYTMVIHLSGGYTNFEYVLSNMSFIFLIVIPVLTMRVIAEERKQKTDQLLYSLPVSMTEVVLGKYLALMTVIAVPLLLICLYPIILNLYGDIYFPAAFGTMLAFLFLGGALSAIGIFISSLTENQVAAAALCLAAMLLNYFLSSLADYVPSQGQASLAAFTVMILLMILLVRFLTKNSLFALGCGTAGEAALLIFYYFSSSSFEGLFADVCEKLSLFERFYVFVDGIFDVTGLVYFLTVTVVFLFLTVQAMEKRRWSE